jgi:hypothetical protein
MFYGTTKDIFLINGSTPRNLALVTKDLIIAELVETEPTEER